MGVFGRSRHYYIIVNKCTCQLEITSASSEAHIVKLRNWSLMYSKSRAYQNEPWTNKFTAVEVNGERVVEKQRMMSVMSLYHQGLVHSKYEEADVPFVKAVLSDPQVSCHIVRGSTVDRAEVLKKRRSSDAAVTKVDVARYVQK